ncbi:NUDIX hydrolase 6-like protein [Tanacetum coccineum]
MKYPHHYLTNMQEVILFYNGFDVPTRQILDSKGAIPTKTTADAKIAIQEMAEYSQKWHNRTSSKARTKRHEENLNIIKEIQASIDAAIRNQGASIKTLEIQIGQMSKVLQERGIRGLAGSTEANPRDYVKSISAAKADSFPFPRRLQNYYCDDQRKAKDVTILEAYDHTLPKKEKDPGSFTLPCFIHNVCFNKALVNLRASVSIMPFSTYTNLGLGILSHTSLTIELADRTIQQPRGIAENVLVRIGKFIFPIDFIILDIPEDDEVPLILGRPFLLLPIPRLMFTKEKLL